MLTWKEGDAGCMLLCKRHIEIARVCPPDGAPSWTVKLDCHHEDDTATFLATSRTQAMNVAEMWAAREGERLDREVASVLRGRRPG